MKLFNIIIILMMLFCILLTSSIVSAGLVTGNTFANIQNEVNNPGNNGTVDLNGGTTYTGSGNPILIQSTGSIVISGPNASNKAILDANYRNYIFNINSTSTIIFRNINFINGNSSISPGGAIIAHSIVIIENCTFDNNYGQSGAAIMMNPGATGSQIRDCNFTNNYGIYENPVWGWGEGAAIDTHADNTTIENCIFENNYIENNGGAISSAIGLNNEIINCTFINNTAGNNGGAILIRNSTIKVENCTFINNSACYGSAIFNDLDSILDIVNCSFTDNFAGTYDIIAPEYIVNTTTNATIEISLVLGDNILDAIYNDQGTVTVNGTTPNELDSSPDQNITLTFEGIDYINTTNASGVAIFNIPTNNLTSGQDYPYTVTYNQTTLYEGINKTSNITVDDNATNFGSVPGTGSNLTTGPTTDIPTRIPPTPQNPQTQPYTPPTNNPYYTPTTTSNNNPTTLTNPGYSDDFKEYKAKISSNFTGTLQIKVEYWNLYVKKGGKKVIKPHKVITYQDYKNGKLVKTYNKSIEVSTNIYFIGSETDIKGKQKYLNYLKYINNKYAGTHKLKTLLSDSYLTKKTIEVLSRYYGRITPLFKAKHLFNHVNKENTYNLYTDTRKGAKVTSKLKKGNCCDKSHLLVWMYRKCNIPSKYIFRYVQVKSKKYYGHVWVSAFINGKWKDNIDPTHRTYNTFEKAGNTIYIAELKPNTKYGDYINLSI